MSEVPLYGSTRRNAVIMPPIPPRHVHTWRGGINARLSVVIFQSDREACQCPARRKQLGRVGRPLPEHSSSQGENLAVTVSFAPSSLDSGERIVRPGIGFQVTVLTPFQVVPSSLGSGQFTRRVPPQEAAKAGRAPNRVIISQRDQHGHHVFLSDTKYSLNRFRKSTPPQNRQLDISISNSKH